MPTIYNATLTFAGVEIPIVGGIEVTRDEAECQAWPAWPASVTIRLETAPTVSGSLNYRPSSARRRVYLGCGPEYRVLRTEE